MIGILISLDKFNAAAACSFDVFRLNTCAAELLREVISVGGLDETPPNVFLLVAALTATARAGDPARSR